jgi:phage-related protein
MMKKLGLNFVDSEGNFKSITNVAKQLHDKLKPLTEAERAQALQVMFGSDATRAATVLMNLGKKGLDEYTTATKEQGKAQELANARMSGTAGAIEKAKGSIETAMKAIGDALAPLVEKVAGWIEQAASAFAGLDPHMQQIIMIFGLVAAAAGPVLIVLGSLVTAVGAIAGVFGAVSLPVLAVVAAIAAVVAVVVLLWNKSEAFRNGVIAIWNAVKAAVAQAIDGLKAKLAENQDKVDALKDGFSKFWQFLQTYVIPGVAKFYEVYLSTLIKVIGWVIEKVIDFYSSLWDFIQMCVDAGRKVWEFGGKVKDAIGVAVDWISQLPDTVKRLFSDAVSWLWDAGKNIVMGLWNGIKGAWDSMVAWVSEKVDALPDAVKTILRIQSPSRVFAEIGKQIPAGVALGVDQGSEKAKAAVRKMGKQLAALSKKQLQTALDKATDVKDAKTDRLTKLRDYFDRLRQIVADGFDALKDEAQSRVDAIQSQLDDLVSAASDFGSSIRQAFSVTLSASGDGSVLAQFRQDISDGQAFLEQVKQLRAAGLNETSLQQIIQAGVQQGKQIADSLLADGPGAINEVNQLQAAFQAQVGALADEMSQAKFGAQIDQARAALQAAQASYAAIVAREAEQLAQLDALGKKFGLETDKMTLTLDDAQKQITEILSHEDTATSVLTDAVSEVTTGLLDTADKMARKAAALQRDISSLEVRIAAINSAIAAKPDGRAVGGPTDAGTPYWVGERGPEIFVPSVSGSVLTASQSARVASSSGGTGLAPRIVTIEAGAVVVHAAGADPADVQAAIDSAFADLVREINRS